MNGIRNECSVHKNTEMETEMEMETDTEAEMEMEMEVMIYGAVKVNWEMFFGALRVS